jgi:hypothetical protein
MKFLVLSLILATGISAQAQWSEIKDTNRTTDIKLAIAESLRNQNFQINNCKVDLDLSDNFIRLHDTRIPGKNGEQYFWIASYMNVFYLQAIQPVLKINYSYDHELVSEDKKQVEMYVTTDSGKTVTNLAMKYYVVEKVNHGTVTHPKYVFIKKLKAEVDCK